MPKKLRDAVWLYYRKGQEVDKDPSLEYLLVQALAREEVARKENLLDDAGELALRATVLRMAITKAGREVPEPLRSAPQTTMEF